MSHADALYEGTVVHHRLAPKRHRLRYRLFQLCVDLDHLPALGSRLRLFGHNRAALFALHDRDHMAGERRPLRPQVEAILRQFGIDLDGGPVRLLCMPRVLGYVFNPLSLYYCHRRSGELAAVLLEVNNTFGERHVYLVEAPPGCRDRLVRLGCSKTFFVSPFLDLDMTYDFRLSAPRERVAVGIVGRGVDGAPIIAAAFEGRYQRLDDRTLVSALARHPLLTLKVILGIHWEALRLLAKGVPLLRRLPGAAHAVTAVGLD